MPPPDEVAEILKQPARKWTAESPASEEDILRLVQSCEVRLPDEYLDLLRFSNGGGAIGLEYAEEG